MRGAYCVDCARGLLYNMPIRGAPNEELSLLAEWFSNCNPGVKKLTAVATTVSHACAYSLPLVAAFMLCAFVDAHQCNCGCQGCHEGGVNHAQRQLAAAVSSSATAVILAAT